MVQTLNTPNIQTYGDTNINVWTAALSVPAPAAYPAQPGTGWYPIGWLDLDAGISEEVNREETKKYALQGASLIRTLRSKEERPVTFTALEENAVTAGLLNPFGSTATTGGTAEVQTVTISGSPAAGTFDLTLGSYGTASGLTVAGSTLPTAPTVQAAVRAAWGYDVTVGLSGSVYTFTFPTGTGNVPQITYANALTGGTSPSLAVATTTPGVNPTNTTHVKPVTGLNLRQFVVDLVSGSGVYHRRWYKNSEATQSGAVPLAKGDDFSVFAFKLDAYLDGNGDFYVDVNNNPSLAAGLFA